MRQDPKVREHARRRFRPFKFLLGLRLDHLYPHPFHSFPPSYTTRACRRHLVQFFGHGDWVMPTRFRFRFRTSVLFSRALSVRLRRRSNVPHDLPCSPPNHLLVLGAFYVEKYDFGPNLGHLKPNRSNSPDSPPRPQTSAKVRHTRSSTIHAPYSYTPCGIRMSFVEGC